MGDMARTDKSEQSNKTRPRYNLFQNSAWMLGRAWHDHKSVIVLVIVSALLGVAASVLSLFIAPTVLAAIQAKMAVGSLIALIIAFALGLMVLAAATGYVGENTLFGRILIRTRIVYDAQEKVMTTSYPNTESEDFHKKHDKAMMACSNNRAATEALWKTFTDILKNVIGFVIYLFLLATLNFSIVALVLVTALIGFFVGNYLNGWEYRHRDEKSEYSHRMNYVSRQTRERTLAKDVRIFGMKEWLDDMYDRSFKLYRDFIAHRERICIWADIVEIVLTFARNGVAYAILIAMVVNQGLSASQFLLYFTAVGGFTTWVIGILTSFSTLHKQSLDLSTVREFLDYPEIFTFEGGEPLPDTGGQYEIELRDVSFRYPGAEKETLEHIDLTLAPGEKLAVVGLNGAGKTTLVKLLCGFVDPTEGEVLLNGENIKKYNRGDYYKVFSAVFQDFSVLPLSVATNIAEVEDSRVEMGKVRSSAQRAGLAGRIDGLPQKFETPVGREIEDDGVELSGGEMQKLMLARALYKDAPLIVLDEPTAALDPIAESEMYSKYNDLTAGRSSVYISHRLASTRFCDRIILIADAHIAEEGTHNELIALGGRYAQLFDIQSRYYRKEAAQND
jgi:ATP-binding cassette subfamily B protein